MTASPVPIAFRARRTPAEHETVSRRIDLPLPAVQAVLAGATVSIGATMPLGQHGVLRLDEPFTLGDRWPVSVWRSTARLQWRGSHAVRFARVRVEVGEWSHDGCELTIVPVARHVALWGTRRQRRYFTLAHLAADDLTTWIVEASRAHHDRLLREIVAVEPLGHVPVS